MKDYITQMIREIPPLKARNVLREYLQARILHAMQKAGAFTSLAFHGGTCLRFLYSIPRYSEDLDFSLEKRDRGYHFDSILKAIRRELAPEGYVFDFKVAERYSVHSAFVRFRGLLYELELSPNHDEVISVKVEIDTNPPTGVGLETTIIRRHVTLNIQHHDKASLLAGKLHALLQRRYTKGRDLYDLVWYLSDPDWPEPNLTMLNNALKHTGWSQPAFTCEEWRRRIGKVLKSIHWKAVQEDAAPFLEESNELSLLTEENLLKLIEI
jgi:predicted nucleotidyltransferase component of viral defense system